MSKDKLNYVARLGPNYKKKCNTVAIFSSNTCCFTVYAAHYCK